ncbi:hypothetical protein OAS19_03535 [Altererythrobacter sp.]|nr:hypothetical protein [Altererythrobacter sp.]
MGWLVLFTLGAAIGWLGSVVGRYETLQHIMSAIVIGGVGAAAGGALGYSGSLAAGLSVAALFFGVIGAAGLLTIAIMLNERIAR